MENVKEAGPVPHVAGVEATHEAGTSVSDGEQQPASQPGVEQPPPPGEWVSAVPSLSPPPRSSATLEPASSVAESEDSYVLPAKSAPAELVTSKSHLRRAQNRAEELRKMFQLPLTEHFLDDFMCALKKKVLLQGRIYLFSGHVCFHCNLFGYQKTKVIPLAAVVDVRKRKNVGFPNSIELTMESGKREFFTSFVAREEAHRLIMAQWRQCSEHAQRSVEEPKAGSGHSRCMSRLLHSVSLRGMGSLVKRESTPEGSTPEPGAMRSNASSLGPVHEDLVAHAGIASPTSLAGNASGSDDHSSLSGDPAAGRAGLESFAAELMQDNSFVVWSTPAHRGTGSDRPNTPGTTQAGGASSGVAGLPPGELSYEFQALTDLQCQKELELEVARNEPAPPVPPGMQHVLEFGLPCPPLEFWSRFLANHSDFLQKFHASRGDTNILLSKWQRHFKVGMVRDLQFVHPVKARIGPPQAVCHQTQRLSVFAGQYLVLEASQVMSGIPYADHFSVETRWDVAPRSGSGGGCCVTVHLQVPFTKKTMWRTFIEKGSYDDSLEAVQWWRRMACERLAADPSTGLSPVDGEPRSEAEWNTLLSKVDPHYWGAVKHLRRHSRAGSSISQQGGIHVGHQLPVLARHRHNASRSEAAAQHGHAASSHWSRPNSKGGSARSSRNNMQQLEEHTALLQGEQAEPSAGQQQQQKQKRPPGASTVSLLACSLLALAGWLLSMLRAGAQALGNRQFAVVACGFAIIAVQAAMLLQQRQQLVLLQQQMVSGASPLSTTGASGGLQLAAAAAALGRDVAQMQQALWSLQSQLDKALNTAADLGQQLQHTTAAAT